MNLKENRKLAFVVLAVVIVFSICVQGSVALLNRRGDTEVLFMEGELHEMMVRCAEQGALLGQMSEVYLNDTAIAQYASAETASVLKNGGYTALPAELQALAAELTAAPDPNACLAALSKLNAAVEKAYTGLEMLDISDADFRNIKLSYYDYKGALDIVSREADSPKSYTAGAVKFNKQIKGFPANLISGLLGVDPLTVYGG